MQFEHRYGICNTCYYKLGWTTPTNAPGVTIELLENTEPGLLCGETLHPDGTKTPRQTAGCNKRAEKILKGVGTDPLGYFRHILF
jgi:hypothetical protein